ncbi:MAG: ABC transporter substrate-binding protein [Planctomycetota bacterium]
MYRRPAVLFTILIILAAIPLVGQDAGGRGRFLDEAVLGFPRSQDPIQVFNPYWSPLYRLCYETPLACEMDDQKRMKIVPKLLAKLPEIDESGRLVTLTLRKGVRFADDACFKDGRGREVEASDLVHTILRHADPATGSLYYRAYFAGRIIGLDAHQAEAATAGALDYESKIRGLRIKSKRVLEIWLTRAYPQLSALMTMPFFSLIPSEARRAYGSGLADNPVGTGPYLFDANASDVKALVYRANPKYWNRGGPERSQDRVYPRNAGVRFQIVPTSKNIESRFKLGDIDFLDLDTNNRSRYLNVFNRLKKSVRPLKSKVVHSDGARLHYLAFNLKNKVLAKKKVRQALALALDRSTYRRQFYRGAARLADHIVPPSVPMATPEASYPWAYGKRDLKRARKLLAEAGYPEGKGMPEFVLDVPYEGKLAKLEVAIIERSFKELGVRIQARIQPFAKYIDRARKGITEISVNYWFADYPDPENFFLMLIAANSPKPGTTFDAPNIGFYKRPEYEALYKRASKLPPGEIRGELFAEMLKILQEDCPWIFIAWPEDSVVTGPRIKSLDTRNRYVMDYAKITLR